MSSRHFELNRPVHLARRDVFFERAAELLNTPVQDMDAAARLLHVSQVISLLETSTQHATFAERANAAAAEGRDFLHFLTLITGNLKSVHSMTQHQSHLEGEKGLLTRFLDVSAEECMLPAQHYRRRADDILQGIWNLLQLALKPYRALQQSNQRALTSEEAQRYRRAHESFRSEVLAPPMK